jgi:superfamily II DNA or RNA helicase
MTYEPHFILTKCTHFFKINKISPRLQSLILRYCDRYVYKSLIKVPKRGFVYAPTRVYAARLKNNSEFRFPINALLDFITFLQDKAVPEELYLIKEQPIYNPQSTTFTIKKGWVPKEYQIPVINYLLENNGGCSKFVGLRTGRGKTFCAVSALAEKKQRTVILIKPLYIEKWQSDFKTLLDHDPIDVMTVSGSQQLKALISLAVFDKLNSNLIIISNRTYQNYIDSYEDNYGNMSSTGYLCCPDQFFETLKAGILLIDEVHQDFYALYRALLYTHIPLSIGLSATLINENWFLQKMYDLIYPKPQRYVEHFHKNYLKVYGIAYSFENVNRIRINEYGSKVYSHHAFERSILLQPRILSNYKKLIHYVVEAGYIRDYIKNDKLIIFASSIAMCTELTKHLKIAYPNLDVRRYVEDDPYGNVIEPDIRVTTLLSAGTAVDIPNLRTSILTVNVLSAQSNIQAPGRLRELKDRDTKFYYLWCRQIVKHERYHQKRVEMLATHVATIKQFDYPGEPL